MMQKKAWNNYLHNYKITSLVKLAADLNHQPNVQRALARFLVVSMGET